ncbi:MAG: CCA tRNA nucleotidyltransferase [Candidatus Cloacimonetes bacterium]|nr:CCA tRNA nucleotidyltransferase [Candidatus Cloacimonadota bacterium]
MQNIISKIKKNIIGTEFENRTYIVGGFVRDLLLGKESNDLDLVVELNNGGVRLANHFFQIGLSSQPVIFKNFGTAYVKIDNQKIELVMTRSESYQDQNRKPQVKAASLEQDIYRRDFTINSLLLNVSTGEILDITGKGKEDLQCKIIRSTSESEKIFREDPLRILRAIRFSNDLKFEIEPTTKNALINNVEHLNFISAERKREEFNKMMISEIPDKAMKKLREYGTLVYLIPEIVEIYDLKQNRYHNMDVWHHTLEVLKNTPPKLTIRIAALLHDIAKKECYSEDDKGIHFYKHEIIGAEIARKVLKKLVYSNEIISNVEILIKNHLRIKQYGYFAEKVTDKTIRKLIYQLGENLDDFLTLVHADNISHAEKFKLNEQIPCLRNKINEMNKQNPLNSLPVSGINVMKYFSINEGREVGEILDLAKELWFENPKLDKKMILEKIERLTTENTEKI